MNSYNTIPPQRGCLPQSAEDPAKRVPEVCLPDALRSGGPRGGMSSSKLATPTSLMHRAREGGLKGTSAKLRAPSLPDALRTGGGPNDIEVTNDPPQGGTPWKERPRPEAHTGRRSALVSSRRACWHGILSSQQQRAATTDRDLRRAGQRNKSSSR